MRNVVTADGVETLSAPGEEMRICAFLWSYYGYPTSNYEGVNVEVMRYRNGAIMADHDKENRGLSKSQELSPGLGGFRSNGRPAGGRGSQQGSLW